MAGHGGGQLMYAPGLVHAESATDNPVDENPPALYGVILGRPMFGSVDIHLSDGQEVVADAGSLNWMDADVGMSTGTYGGCCDAMWRSYAGESWCMNTYTGPGLAGFGFPLPGDLVAFAVYEGKGWMLSKGAFVAGSTNLQITGKCNACTCFFGMDEGAFLTAVKLVEGSEKPGLFYAGGYGGIDRHRVEAGKTLMIDNGMFFACLYGQKISVSFAGGGAKEFCFSSEGLVMVINGPATVFTQNRDPSIFKPPEDTSGDA